MNDIIKYIVKRLLSGVLVVLCVTVIIFAIMQAMPGDPVEMVTDVRVAPEKLAEIKAQWGLDKPPVLQYFYWLGNILQGNLGTSISTSQSVGYLIQQRLPYTLMLTGAALALEYLLAIPLGLLAAVRKNGVADKLLTVVTIVLWSMPGFWLGVLFMLVFSIQLNLLPISGYQGLISLILPAITLALPNMAQIFRLTRSEVLDVLDEKYVVTAYAKGISKGKILVRHVLRNALIPVTITFFLSLPWLIGGSVVVEKVFAWPGMGQLLWTAISKQDFPIVQGVVLIIAILTVVCNLIGDLIAGILDPRIRLE
ncbi:ABC transporter permease [Flavonifractor hominis]|uniref:ABC transporter permease n=1 Tax=Flavonifractor hominis TaxID=3133178 RepID=A0ABV1EW45_9FIRM